MNSAQSEDIVGDIVSADTALPSGGNDSPETQVEMAQRPDTSGTDDGNNTVTSSGGEPSVSASGGCEAGRDGEPCVLGNADGRCSDGTCQVDACADGYFDADSDSTNGCECMPSSTNIEICDDKDDDCDGQVDEGFDVGSPCPVGIGSCVAQGITRCGDDGQTVCEGQPLEPMDELCNGLDDDCDARTDEDFNVGTACEAGRGICRSAGTIACDGPEASKCDATIGQASSETCNGLDDDCDGLNDEDFNLGQECTNGALGRCASAGVFACELATERAFCDAPLIPPAVNEDRDGDGILDLNEDMDGDGRFDMDEDTNQNGILDIGEDLDGDGRLDINEDIDGDGQFDAINEDVNLNGVLDANEDRDGDGYLDTGEDLNHDGILNFAEACNGEDDDCDGVLDEGAACGAYLASHCQVTLAWSDQNAIANTPNAWDSCYTKDLLPVEDDLNGNGSIDSNEDRNGNGILDDGEDADGNGVLSPPERLKYNKRRCVTTDKSPQFRTLPLPGMGPSAVCSQERFDEAGRFAQTYRVDNNDHFAIAFKCTDDDQPAIAEYIQNHCTVFLGWADRNEGPTNGSTQWGECPSSFYSETDPSRCTSSGYSGVLSPMNITGEMNDDDVLAIAFICQDGDAPERARGLEASIAIDLAWASTPGHDVVDGATSWSTPCSAAPDRNAESACVSSAGDGRFHRLLVGDIVAGYPDSCDEDVFGIRLRALQ